MKIPLQLASAQQLHITVLHVVQFQLVHDPLHVAPLALRGHDVDDFALHGFRNVVHILGLDDGLQIILQDAGKVILQLRTAKLD